MKGKNRSAAGVVLISRILILNSPLFSGGGSFTREHIKLIGTRQLVAAVCDFKALGLDLRADCTAGTRSPFAGLCLASVWSLSGLCLVSFWSLLASLSGLFLNQFWSSQQAAGRSTRAAGARSAHTQSAVADCDVWTLSMTDCVGLAYFGTGDMRDVPASVAEFCRRVHIDLFPVFLVHF